MSSLAETTVPQSNHPSPALDFTVGQNLLGQWLAIESHGLAGGVFVSREAAIRYVASECNKRRDAVRVSVGPLRATI